MQVKCFKFKVGYSYIDMVIRQPASPQQVRLSGFTGLSAYIKSHLLIWINKPR